MALCTSALAMPLRFQGARTVSTRPLMRSSVGENATEEEEDEEEEEPEASLGFQSGTGDIGGSYRASEARS